MSLQGFLVIGQPPTAVASDSAMADAKQTIDKPDAAQTVISILHDMGVSSFNDGVVNQLLELLNRYVCNVANDSAAIAANSMRYCTAEDDVKLAILQRRQLEFTHPPAVDVAIQLSAELNKQPLPGLPETATSAMLLLPQKEDCLGAQNYYVVIDQNRPPRPKQPPPPEPLRRLKNDPRRRSTVKQHAALTRHAQLVIARRRAERAHNHSGDLRDQRTAQAVARAIPLRSRSEQVVAQGSVKSPRIGSPAVGTRSQRFVAQRPRFNKSAIEECPERPDAHRSTFSQPLRARDSVTNAKARITPRVNDHRTAVTSSQSYVDASANLIQSATAVRNTQRGVQSKHAPQRIPRPGSSTGIPHNTHACQIFSQAGPSVPRPDRGPPEERRQQKRLPPTHARSMVAAEEIRQSFIAKDGGSNALFNQMPNAFGLPRTTENDQQTVLKVQRYAFQKHAEMLKRRQLQVAVNEVKNSSVEAHRRALATAHLQGAANARRQDVASGATHRATDGQRLTVLAGSQQQLAASLNAEIETVGKAQEETTVIVQRQRNFRAQRRSAQGNSVEARATAHSQEASSAAQMGAERVQHQRVANAQRRAATANTEMQLAVVLNAQGRASSNAQQAGAVSLQRQQMTIAQRKAATDTTLKQMQALLNAQSQGAPAQQPAVSNIERQRIANARRHALVNARRQQLVGMSDPSQVTSNPYLYASANAHEKAIMARQQAQANRARAAQTLRAQAGRATAQRGEHRVQSVQASRSIRNIPRRSVSALTTQQDGDQRRMGLQQGVSMTRGGSGVQFPRTSQQRRSQKRPRLTQSSAQKRQRLGVSSAMPPSPEIVDLDGPGAIEVSPPPPPTALPRPTNRHSGNRRGPQDVSIAGSIEGDVINLDD